MFHVITQQLAVSQLTTTVIDWVNRCVRSGSVTPSRNTVLALDKFVINLTKHGLINKIGTANCFVPDNIVCARTPILYKPEAPYWNDTSTAFVNADLTINGLKSPSGAKGLTTVMVTQNYYSSASVGTSVYCSENDTNGARDIGGSTTGNYDGLFQHISLSGNDFWTLDGNTTQINGPAPASWNGFHSGNRVSDSFQAIYIANSTASIRQVASTTSHAGQMLTCGQIGVFRSYNTISGLCTKRFSFFAVHTGLIISDAGLLFTDVQQMRVDLGGGYS